MMYERQETNAPSYAPVALGVLVAGSLVFDLLVPHLAFGTSREGIFGALVTGFILGLFAAQFNLISTWAALGQGAVVVRLPWTLLLTVMIWYAILLGTTLSRDLGRLDPEGAVVLGVTLLAATIVTQTLLWILGRMFGWCFVIGNMPPRDRETFDLRQLLLGVSLLTASLGFVRFVLPDGDRFGIGRSPDEIHAILLVVLASINPFLIVPIVWHWAGLPVRLKNPLIFWSVWISLVTLVEIATLHIVLDIEARVYEALVMICLNLTQCAVVLAALTIMQSVDIQLIRHTDSLSRCSQERPFP